MFGFRPAQDIPKGVTIMVGPEAPLVGYLREWPIEVALEPWQQFSAIKSER